MTLAPAITFAQKRHKALDPDISLNRHDGTDSGYVSQNSSPGSRQEKSPKFHSSPSNYIRKGLCRNVRLQFFDVIPPQNVQARFRDLKILYDEPLFRHLFSDGTPPSPVSITLRYRGATAEDAQPYFYVMCSHTLARKVKNFFKRRDVKDAFRSRNDDLESFALKIIIDERPPIQLAGSGFDILGWKVAQHDINKSLCGTLVKAIVDGETRYATLGGIIEVSNGPDTDYYGLTVEHFLLPQPSITALPTTSKSDVANDDDLSDSDSIFASDSEADLQESQQDDCAQAASSYPTKESLHSRFIDTKLWDVIGSPVDMPTVKRQSSEKVTTGLDWTLVSFNNPRMCFAGNQGPKWTGHMQPLKRHARIIDGDGFGARVTIMAGVSGVRLGTIAQTSAMLTVGTTLRLVETYRLSLDLGEKLKTGDCGSWVHDYYSGVVYGQVVASDALGDVYVVPLDAIFREVKDQLQASSVDIAASFELSGNVWICQGPPSADEQAHKCRICHLLKMSGTCVHGWEACMAKPEDERTFRDSKDMEQHLINCHDICQSKVCEEALDDWRVFKKIKLSSPINPRTSALDSGYHSMNTSPGVRLAKDVPGRKRSRSDTIETTSEEVDGNGKLVRGESNCKSSFSPSVSPTPFMRKRIKVAGSKLD